MTTTIPDLRTHWMVATDITLVDTGHGLTTNVPFTEYHRLEARLYELLGKDRVWAFPHDFDFEVLVTPEEKVAVEALPHITRLYQKQWGMPGPKPECETDGLENTHD